MDVKGARLSRVIAGDVASWTDVALVADLGVRVAFTERGGGVSESPFASLNLAAHVGDDPRAVDANRDLVFEALGLTRQRSRLVTAEQVHGDAINTVGEPDAGSGAYAQVGRGPIASCDGLSTTQKNLPLMLFFADCVPVVLVAPGPSGPAVCVVHAGWRGALARIVASGVERVCELGGASARDVRAYVGAHIGACCYPVDERILSLFVNTFDTLARAESGGLDLGYVVAASLTHVGVDPCNIASLGTCTAETTDRFFSYRAESQTTGRHGALVSIVG